MYFFLQNDLHSKKQSPIFAVPNQTKALTNDVKTPKIWVQFFELMGKLRFNSKSLSNRLY